MKATVEEIQAVFNAARRQLIPCTNMRVEGDDAEWRLLPEPTACEGHTHRYYNNEDKCVCGRGPDLSKRRMR